MREIPRSTMTTTEATVFVVISSVVFMAASWMLEPAVRAAVSDRRWQSSFWLSLAKRYTNFTQAFLGLAMAVAVGGWLAAGGRGGWEPWLLGAAIALWVGGFDVLYACRMRPSIARMVCDRFPCGWDRAFAADLSSDAPGCRRVHGGTYRRGGYTGAHLVGVVLVAVLLLYEQSLVSKNIPGKRCVRSQRLCRHSVTRDHRNPSIRGLTLPVASETNLDGFRAASRGCSMRSPHVSIC